MVSSQTITIIVNVVPPTPPPPPINGPGTTVPIIHVDPVVTNGTIANVEYPNPVLQYLWTINGVRALPSPNAPSPAVAGLTNSFQIDSPQLAFNTLALPPGYYQLQVRAAEAGRISDPGFAYITVAASDFSGIRVYPNPWRSDRHGGSPHINFDPLPPDTTLEIFTISGHHVKTLNGGGADSVESRYGLGRPRGVRNLSLSHHQQSRSESPREVGGN